MTIRQVWHQAIESMRAYWRCGEPEKEPVNEHWSVAAPVKMPQRRNAQGRYVGRYLKKSD